MCISLEDCQEIALVVENAGAAAKTERVKIKRNDWVMTLIIFSLKGVDDLPAVKYRDPEICF